MAIITSSDLYDMFDTTRIDDLATDASDGGGENATRLSALINQADSYIKGQLTKQYAVAVIEADYALQRIAGVMVMYYLESRRSTVTVETREGYVNALQYIRDIQEGTAILSGTTQVLPDSIADPTEVFEESGLFEGMPDLEP